MFLEYLASGMSVEEVLADFPDLTAEDIRACLAFAAGAKGSFGCASAALAQRGPAVWRAGWQGGKRGQEESGQTRRSQAIRGTIRQDRAKSGKIGRSKSARHTDGGNGGVVGHRKILHINRLRRLPLPSKCLFLMAWWRGV